MSKPLLLLDVDGVLAPYTYPGWDVAGTLVTAVVGNHKLTEVCYKPEMPNWLEELSKPYELVWATLWEDRANDFLSPLWGLPSLPVVPFIGQASWPSETDEESLAIRQLVEHKGTAKLPGVQEYLEDKPDQPVAWIDDSIGFDAVWWQQKRGEKKTLLLDPHPVVGMTRQHVDIMLQWANG